MAHRHALLPSDCGRPVSRPGSSRTAGGRPEVPLALYRTDPTACDSAAATYPSVPVRTRYRIGIEWLGDMNLSLSDESESRLLTVSSP